MRARLPLPALVLPSLLLGCAVAPRPVLHQSDTAYGPEDPGDWTVGYRAGTALGDGEPANDIPVPLSLFGRYEWDADWAIGFGLDYMEGDFEEPAEILGLKQEQDRGAIDSTATYTQIGAWVERLIVARGRNGLAGLALASVDVDDVDGPLANGGRFDVETDADTETVGMVAWGVLVLLDHARIDVWRRQFSTGAVACRTDYDPEHWAGLREHYSLVRRTYRTSPKLVELYFGAGAGQRGPHPGCGAPPTVPPPDRGE